MSSPTKLFRPAGAGQLHARSGLPFSGRRRSSAPHPRALPLGYYGGSLSGWCIPLIKTGQSKPAVRASSLYRDEKANLFAKDFLSAFSPWLFPLRTILSWNELRTSNLAPEFSSRRYDGRCDDHTRRVLCAAA